MWRTDAVALASLSGIPALLFAAAALAGHPLLTGDAVIQDLPLRVIAGQALVHGHLPLVNPYDFSGEPLLGGFNAGAAFPDIVLFGILPPVAAWVVAEALAYAAAACGLYLFLRANRLRPLASWLGGVTYGLGGFVSSQAVHIDVVETAACLAWALLAVERVAHDGAARRPAWAALLAVAAGCAALAASPEAAFDAAAGTFVYALHLLWRERRPWRLAGWLTMATVAGALLGGAQISTGADFVAASQRSHVSYGFATSGTIDRGLVLLLAPHLLGGGPIGLASFVGSYNLAEIDAYTGIAALMGAAWLAACRRRRGASRWRVWYAVGAVGLLVATGGRTGVAHLLVHLPVIGASRLPSRAVLLYSLATAVLLAYFAAELVSPGSVTAEPGTGALARLISRRRTGVGAGVGAVPTSGGAGKPGSRAAGSAWGPPGGNPCSNPLAGRAGRGREGADGAPPGARAAAAAVPLAVLALVAVVALGGVPVARALAGHGVGPWSVGRLAPYLALTAGLAILALVLALGAGRLSSTGRCRLLVVLVACDLLLFTADQSSFAPLRSAALGQPSPLAAALRRAVDGGRFVIVDAARSGGAELNALGAPDLNALLGIASAQGYGSLLWAPYQAATDTHGQDVAAPAAFAGTTFDSLDVRTLLALPSDFAGPAGSGATGTAQWHVGAAAPATRLFGGTVEVASVTLSLLPADRSRPRRAAPEPGAPPMTESVAGARGARRAAGPTGAADRQLMAAASHLRLLGSDGRLLTAVGSPVVGDGSVTLHFRPAATAAGLSLRLKGGSLSLSAPTVRPARGPRVALDGELAGAVTAPHWMPEGTIGPYTAYRDTRATGLYTLRPITEAAAVGPPARLAGGPARSLPARTETPVSQARLGRLEVVPGSPWSGQSAVDVWAASTVALVRSVADLPGWHATLDVGGTIRSLPIARHGLVQSVVLPRGHSEVLFTYTAPGLGAGVAASIAGAAIVLGLLAIAATGERRRSSTLPPLGSPRQEGNPETRLPAALPTA